MSTLIERLKALAAFPSDFDRHFTSEIAEQSLAEIDRLTQENARLWDEAAKFMDERAQHWRFWKGKLEPLNPDCPVSVAVHDRYANYIHNAEVDASALRARSTQNKSIQGAGHDPVHDERPKGQAADDGDDD